MFRMSAKIGSIYLLIIMNIILANGEYNNSLENLLKTKFDCIPLENWSLIRSKNQVIKNLCISKDYQVDDEPTGNKVNPVFMRFKRTEVTNVNDQRKTLTIEVKAISIWEDNRIKANFLHNNSMIKIPSSTVEEASKIWIPLASVYIWNLKTRTHILDPVTITIIGVRRSDLTNNFYSINTFSPNSSVVWSSINWRITVGCQFEFSMFPFDENNCALKMGFRNMPVVLYNDSVSTLQGNNLQYEKIGFNFKLRNLPIITTCDKILGDCWTSFGYGIKINRVTSKYLFQYYVPCVTIVIASTLSFIVPSTAAPGRIALVVTQFLTLTNIFIYQKVSDKLV